MEMKVSEELWYYLDDCLCDAVRFSHAPTLAKVYHQMRPHRLTVKENQVEAMSEFLLDIAETETGSIGTEAAKLANKLTD